MTVEDIDVFVEVVDAQSFSRAANRLKMPTSTVSAKIARIEARLEVTLIQRTTRRLFVTPAGQRYYQRCMKALKELGEGERELVDSQKEPNGLLRITVPSDFTQQLLAPTVQRYLETFPKTSVELIVTNRVVDLVAEGIDLGIRAGPQRDSTLVIKKFISGRSALFASPEYLKRKGRPKSINDLKSHDLIRFSRREPILTLKNSEGEAIKVNFQGRLAIDDLGSVQRYIQNGAGIGLLPLLIGPQLLTEHNLIQVLPGYFSELFTTTFVYPAQRFVP